MDGYEYPYESGPDLGPRHHTSVSHFSELRTTRWDDELGPVPDLFTKLVLSDQDPLMREWNAVPRKVVGDWHTCASCGEQYFTTTTSPVCATCESRH